MEITLKIKLASIVVHLEEARSVQGQACDWIALEALLQDPEIQDFIKSIEPAMLPVKR